jgi:hypothetical protein
MTRQQAEPGGDSDAAARVLKRIQGHVALGELRSAGKLLQEHALAGPALDELTAWRSSLSQLDGDSRAGVLGAADHAQARRKLASELLRLARAALEPDAERSGRPPHLAAGSSGADLAAAPGTGSEHRPVFLSYSHADSAVAQALRSALEQAGIGVRIDVAAMRPGESIEAFVRTSIRDTRATVCLVSKASLMSGWVGLETLRALADQALWEQRRFVACALDDAYQNPDVRLELTRRIDRAAGAAQAAARALTPRRGCRTPRVARRPRPRRAQPRKRT